MLTFASCTAERHHEASQLLKDAQARLPRPAQSFISNPDRDRVFPVLDLMVDAWVRDLYPSLEIVMNAPINKTKHFNLHTNGVGYLNRVRWVEPSRTAGRRAEPFLACSISALRGDSDNPDYTYFDLRVSGREAIEMVERLEVDVRADRKVFVSFRIGDIYPHTYERDVIDRKTGRKTGEREIASLIKGRLLLINSITIDGENVFRRESDAPVEEVPAFESRQEQQPVRHERQAYSQPQERQPEAVHQSQARYQAQDQRPAYRGGYVAGRTVRRAADRFVEHDA